jgi:hypothetical protein
MPMKDPVAAYIAATNFEAHFICNILMDAGIEAAVEEDVSQVGVWMLGLASQLHRPKVWIEQSDWDRAKLIVTAYEEDVSARRAAEQGKTSAEFQITARCEECGAETAFSSQLDGTVQNCPKCQGFMDVGDGEPGFDWQ